MHQEFDPRDLEPSMPHKEERSTRSKLAPILIAGVALAGFGGVVWYAYDQGIRQTAAPTTTPLIKADTTPTKIRPDQPGGMDVPHQDKLVLNSLADANKAGGPQVERLLPPPESPLPRPAPTAQAPVMTPAPGLGNGQTATLPPKIGPAPPSPPTALPLTTNTAAPPPVAAAPRDAVQASGGSGAPPVPPPAAAPPQVAAAPAATPKPPAEKPKATPAAAPSATGGFKVQLVSVKAEGETKNEWARLQRTYPQLAPLKMSVTRVDLGDKGIWYRIYAGPLSDAHAAGELCSALKAKGQGCVVAKS